MTHQLVALVILVHLARLRPCHCLYQTYSEYPVAHRSVSRIEETLEIYFEGSGELMTNTSA